MNCYLRLQTWLNRRIEIIARRKSLQSGVKKAGLTRTRVEFLDSCGDVSSIRRKGSALERDEPEYHRQIFCLCKHLRGVGFKVL